MAHGAGAVTWGNSATDISGLVSAANSLVGSTSKDQVGGWGVAALTNGNYVGNYVVASPFWDNGNVIDAGAVTWGNGATGNKGAVSAANSLVGSTANDYAGLWGVTALSNGNYVVASPTWNNTAAASTSAGAATWGNGATGTTGAISATNSLVGSNPGDAVGYGVTALTNGNYVVASYEWSNGAGAVTWGNGTAGTHGVVSSSNSLVGAYFGDQVGYCQDGYSCVTPLSNGNYVVQSPYWENGNVVDAGAVTWGNGATGVKGVVSSANSLIGSSADDWVGCANHSTGVCSTGVAALSNGNYVVASPDWDNGATANVGAVTWGNGTTGIKGAVSAANSLIGSTAGDQVGGVTALSNGNYVVASPTWDNGAVVDAGSVTWGNGATGLKGVVSAANSLVGSTADDRVGCGSYNDSDGCEYYSVTVLSNGNYLVASPTWNNGAVTDAGAVTWGNGTTGVKGAISAANSLVGSTGGDMVGSVTALSNGNYVVVSPDWNKGATANVGAVTWGSGTIGIKGAVSAANSLVGSTAGDHVGCTYVDSGYCDDANVTALSNGDYVAQSTNWHNGTTVNAGAITIGAGAACSTGPAAAEGPITAANSVLGTAANGGYDLNYDYDSVHQQLVVGRPTDNIITLFALSCSGSNHAIFLPVIKK